MAQQSAARPRSGRSRSTPTRWPSQGASNTGWTAIKRTLMEGAILGSPCEAGVVLPPFSRTEFSWCTSAHCQPRTCPPAMTCKATLTRDLRPSNAPAASSTRRPSPSPSIPCWQLNLLEGGKQPSMMRKWEPSAHSRRGLLETRIHCTPDSFQEWRPSWDTFRSPTSPPTRVASL